MWIDDEILIQCKTPFFLKIWSPQKTHVVLGASNQINTEVNEDYCKQNDIPILKRCGGGGTVVLYSGCVIISFGCWVKRYYENKFYFNLINGAINNVLSRQLNTDIASRFTQAGISDLCYGEKKYGGTSLFRSKGYLLYQASVICKRNAELINLSLKHPSREPDYRRGRSHAEFLIGTQEIAGTLTSELVEKELIQNFPAYLRSVLEDELIDPDLAHTTHLLQRINSDK